MFGNAKPADGTSVKLGRRLTTPLSVRAVGDEVCITLDLIPGSWVQSHQSAEDVRAQCEAQPGDQLNDLLVDCFTVRTPRSDPLVFVSDPAAVKAIFTGDPELLRAGAAREGIRPMFGARSILLLDGAEHLRERRLMLPAFHGQRMVRYGQLMAEISGGRHSRARL